MKLEIENILPGDIERRSFELIEQEMHTTPDPLFKPILKRVIHTTADFEYEDTLKCSEGAVEHALDALKKGAWIITDTNMVKAGINKQLLSRLGGEVHCFMADEEVRRAAKENGTTRAVASMEKAAACEKPVIFAIGNAPTALLKVCELVSENRLHPELVVGVPVGFVNVEVSKEVLMEQEVPYITAVGRKGGSNVAASIINALIYMLEERE
ncbi:MAG: precorrin-8X methylmutase [Lachnospiraceae bacterium]